MLKACPGCEKEKPLTEFYKTRSQCKECVKAAQRKAYKEDLEMSRQIAKVRHETDEKAAERRIKAYFKRYQVD